MKLRFLSLPLLLPLLTWGQNQIVRGRVVEEGTNRPLPFVTLSVADGQLSSATNAEGFFMLSLPDSNARDTLTFTTLNHKSLRLSVSALTGAEPVVRLPSAEPGTTTADTYFDTARPFATRDTLLKVVANIARNYSHQPTLLHCFYREAVRNEVSNAAVLDAEGLIDIYKPSYHFPKQPDRIRFIKGRRNPLKRLTLPILTAGPWVGNMLDVVKYQDFLFRNNIVNKQYAFTKIGDALIGDQPVYIIQFYPRDDARQDGYFTGLLYVATGSLAIVRAEYSLTPLSLGLLNQLRGYMQRLNVRLIQRTYIANYTRFGQEWSFQGGSVESLLQHTPSIERLKARIDIIVTQRSAEKVELIRHTEEASYERLPMQPFDAADTAFWQGETYLLP